MPSNSTPTPMLSSINLGKSASQIVSFLVFHGLVVPHIHLVLLRGGPVKLSLLHLLSSGGKKRFGKTHGFQEGNG